MGFHGFILGRSLSRQHGAYSGCGRRNGIQFWTVAENIWSKQPLTRAVLEHWWLSVGLTTLHRKNKYVTKMSTEART
jgi:hypothetical protein